MADRLAEDESNHTARVRIVCEGKPKHRSATIHAGRFALLAMVGLTKSRLEGTMSPRTLFLSRLIGLYCILIALSMITRKQATLQSVTAVLRDPAMIFVVGAITLIAGLAMVLAHNIWSGGALAVIVTLVGWVTLIKSLSFLFLPPEAEAEFFLQWLHYQELFYLYGAISLGLGMYLTYRGFRSTSH
jgi:hypothetical protein